VVRGTLGYPFFGEARRFLILCELGRQDEAREVLDTARREVQDDWLRQIFRCLAGELAPDQLIAYIATSDNPEQICEAYYYAGEVSLLVGNRQQARQWFQKAVDTGVELDRDTKVLTPMNEYELAQWRLSKLPASEPDPDQ